MYVTPRPDPVEDPLYAIRLALTGTLAYATIPFLNPALPAILAALPLGIIAAQRRAFVPAKAMAGPVALIVMVFVMTWAVEHLRPMPYVYVGTMWLVFFLSFREILRTGAPLGMLIIVVALLMSIMGMHGTATVEAMRNDMVLAALVAFVLAPVVYALLPARTRAVQVDDPVPSRGNINAGAAIRASVLLVLCFWLYSVMQPSDMTMALVAAMVIVFPSRQTVWDEALQRVRATMMGAGVAMAILAVFLLSSHLAVLLAAIFLAGLWLGNLMLHGKRPAMVYQYAFSVALSLVAGALSSQDPAYASFTRIVLTLAGAFSAAFLVALLDALTGWRAAVVTDAERGAQRIG